MSEDTVIEVSKSLFSIRALMAWGDAVPESDYRRFPPTQAMTPVELARLPSSPEAIERREREFTAWLIQHARAHWTLRFEDDRPVFASRCPTEAMAAKLLFG